MQTILQHILVNPVFSLAGALLALVIGYKMNVAWSNWLVVAAWVLLVICTAQAIALTGLPFPARLLVTIGCAVVLGVGLYYLLWTKIQNKNAGLPGMSVYSVITVNHLVRDQRKYIFDFGTENKARLSVYISADNIFTILFVDAKGEPHPIQLPMGSEGIPIGQRVHMVCELGTGGGFTVMRLLVNGREIRALELPFKADVGTLDVPNGVIGADLQGKNGASFELSMLAVFSVTLKPSEMRAFMKRTKQLMKDIPNKPHVEFRGNQWLRFGEAMDRFPHDAVRPSLSPQP